MIRLRLIGLLIGLQLIKGACAQEGGSGMKRAIKQKQTAAATAVDGRMLEETHGQLSSPDGRIRVEIYQKEGADGKKGLFYKVAFKDRPIILESALDIRMDNHIMESALALKPDTAADWCASLSYQKTDSVVRDTSWRPLYGENAVVRDHYKEVTLSFVKADRPKYTMQLICRAYDEGVAFRYYFPENPTGVYYHITAENTEFVLPPDTKAWFTSWAQGPYQLLPLRAWPDESERPLPLRLANGSYVSLAEAQMVDYARTKFKLSMEKPNTIQTALFGGVDGITYFGTPWRVIMVGEQATDLIRNEALLLNLNPPTTLAQTDWIQPGKIIREMTLTTEGARAAIDFAAAHHLQYILFDWKWYGPAMTYNTDATKVVAPIDMAGVVQYGKEKGIGVWLYVNQQSLLKQLDTILPLYERWGIKGVKFGFVELGSQRWTVWLEEAIQKAATHHLMVDVHDEWRPTGEQRTWPNLLSAEGIRGNEEMPDATHNTVLPFTRFIAGPADYTICYYDHRIKTTHSHQLALAAIYYSPLMTLFWYDKPAAYQQEPEIEFFEKIPASWDETKVLDGQPGEFVTIVRRRGRDWFLGTITNNSARNTTIALNFLPPGEKYIATIYSDDATVKTATHVRRVEKKVDASTVLTAELLPSGGEAIWLRPAQPAVEGNVLTMTLANTLDRARPDEPVIWRRAELEKKLGVIGVGKYIQVSKEKGEPVVVQFDDLDGDGQWDEAYWLYSFLPKETVSIKVAVTDAPAAVKAVVRAHVRMRAKNEDNSFGPDLDSAVMPVRNPPTDFSVQRLPPWLTEGPAWENDKVAYRLYFDTRNDKDIYGKTTGRMVMEEVGINPDKSYHELADWGMDILKVGTSLGAGALALAVPREGRKDSLVRLGGLAVKREVFHKVADGPLRAIFRMNYEWELEGQRVTVTEETSIGGGQYYYTSKVIVGGAPAGSRLVTGIANFYSNEPGNFGKEEAEVLYSHGRQSENKDFLGMGILVGKADFSSFGSLPASGADVTSTYTVSQYIHPDKPLYFRFYTCWEKTDPGWAVADTFTGLLSSEAERFSHPVQVTW